MNDERLEQLLKQALIPEIKEDDLKMKRKIRSSSVTHKTVPRRTIKIGGTFRQQWLWQHFS